MNGTDVQQGHHQQQQQQPPIQMAPSSTNLSSSTPIPNNSNPTPNTDTPNPFTSEKDLLNGYIYDYLIKQNLIESAKTFFKEADVKSANSSNSNSASPTSSSNLKTANGSKSASNEASSTPGSTPSHLSNGMFYYYYYSNFLVKPSFIVKSNVIHLLTHPFYFIV